MRYARFTLAGTTRFGTIEGDRVTPFALPVASLQALLAYDGTPPRDEPIASSDVTILAPIVPAKNVFCVGRNYLAHAAEGARAAGRELKLPDVPTFFTKAPTAIANPDATLHLAAAVSPEYDFEAELAVVIGKRARDLTRENALDAVFGYTCLNDVTARDLQKSHLQWFKGKSLDDTCPIGPFIVSADEIGDPQTLHIALRVDGVEKQNSDTGQMIFDVKAILESLSRGMTLEPGDVIATGTPEGVGFARTPPEFLRDGQRMEVEIEKIGVLANALAIR